MNLRSLWAAQVGDKPTSDALEYITKRINLIWTREHDGNTGAHATIHASGPIFERGRTVAMGDWINVAFNAANFAAGGGGTWVVASQSIYSYQLVGETMTLSVETDASTIAGVVNPLIVTVPDGFVTAKVGAIAGATWIAGGGIAEMGMVFVPAVGANTLHLYRAPLIAYPAGNYRVGFTAVFEVQ